MKDERAAHGCAGKVRFETMKLARRVSKRWKKGGDVHQPPYHCKACHGFHLGAQQARKNINKRPRYEPTDEEVMA